MTFQWSEFLTLARSLASNPICPGPPDACRRSATSRAYYAAFHHARDRAVKDRHLYPKQYISHPDLIAYFRNSSDPARQLIGDDLDTARGYRNDADYKLNPLTPCAKAAGYVVTLSLKIIEAIDKL